MNGVCFVPPNMVYSLALLLSFNLPRVCTERGLIYCHGLHNARLYLLRYLYNASLDISRAQIRIRTSCFSIVRRGRELDLDEIRIQRLIYRDTFSSREIQRIEVEIELSFRGEN